MGANTAVFSVMNAVMLRSLPVADADRVAYFRTTNPPKGTGTIDSSETFSYPVYDALRKQSGAMSAVLAFVPLSGSKVAVWRPRGVWSVPLVDQVPSTGSYTSIGAGSVVEPEWPPVTATLPLGSRVARW